MRYNTRASPHMRSPNISLYIRRFQLPLTSVTRHEDAQGYYKYAIAEMFSTRRRLL